MKTTSKIFREPIEGGIIILEIRNYLDEELQEYEEMFDVPHIVHTKFGSPEVVSTLSS